MGICRFRANVQTLTYPAMLCDDLLAALKGNTGDLALDSLAGHVGSLARRKESRRGLPPTSDRENTPRLRAKKGGGVGGLRMSLLLPRRPTSHAGEPVAFSPLA